jgi:hypothetical protein
MHPYKHNHVPEEVVLRGHMSAFLRHASRIILEKALCDGGWGVGEGRRMRELLIVWINFTLFEIGRTVDLLEVARCLSYRDGFHPGCRKNLCTAVCLKVGS